MSIFEDKQKIGLISSELKNRHNVKTECVCFSAVISGLKQEEKYKVYEDNYYRLQEYKSLEKELGIDLATLVEAQQQGIWVKSKRNGIEYGKAVLIGNTSIHCSVYSTKYANNRGRSYKTKNIKDYGRTWALTREELE